MEKGKRLNVKKLENMARSTANSKTKKLLAASKGKVAESDSSMPLVERNFPTDVDELFVHKKKVDEVRQWILGAFSGRKMNGFKSKICVLMGPSGSGKTATVGVLSKELVFQVREWINPMNLVDYTQVMSHGEDVHGRSQTDLFADFLLRSSQYSALPLRGTVIQGKRVVVVEDFPNAFFREPSVFHNLLRNYQLHGASPLIFITPDSAQSGHLKLFPRDVVQELHIQSISFNAVAPTLMKKFLTDVCQRENVSVQPSIMEGICVGSAGDVRCAVNMLHFRILEQCASNKDGQGFKRPFPVGRKTAKGSAGSQKGDNLMRQDETLMLFHALGKVLYNKRDRTINELVEDELIESLASERRIHPPESDPDDFLGKIEVSADTFVNFLHQNYPFFFGDIETCSKAAKYLSDAESVLSRWVEGDRSGSSFHSFKAQDMREQGALHVAVRGIMHANIGLRSNQYRPFRKPLCGDLRSKIQKNEEKCRNAFDSQPVMANCFTEVVPFLAKIPSRYTSEQQGAIQSLANFKLKGMSASRELSRNPKFADNTEMDVEEEEVEETVPGTPNQGNKGVTVKIAKLETCDVVNLDTEDDFRIDEDED